MHGSRQVGGIGCWGRPLHRLGTIMIHSVAVSLSARNDTSDKTQGGEESLREEPP